MSSDWVSIDNETDRLIKESREDDRVAEARQRQEYVKEELAAGRNPSTRAEEQMERDMDDLRDGS